jgi:hypothetical protein
MYFGGYYKRRYDTQYLLIPILFVATIVTKQKSYYSLTMSVKLHMIGDSNIDRYLPLVKAVKEDPGIQETTFARATNMVQLQEALAPANPTVSHPDVILACMTNPITNFAFEDYSSLMVHCTKTFSQIQAWIQEGRGALQGTLRQVSSYIGSYYQ